MRLRIGALAGVVEDALRFSYGLAKDGTRLQDSALEIDLVPVAIYCRLCEEERTLCGVQSFRCPMCGTPSGDLRRGRELEIAAVVLETETVSA